MLLEHGGERQPTAVPQEKQPARAVDNTAGSIICLIRHNF